MDTIFTSMVPKKNSVYIFKFLYFPQDSARNQISLQWMVGDCRISLTHWHFVVLKDAYKTWSVICQPFLEKRGIVKIPIIIDVDCSIRASHPHFIDGKVKQSYLPRGLFFIYKQNNSTICSKSLVYNIKLHFPPNYFSCLLWSKTCVVRDSFIPSSCNPL